MAVRSQAGVVALRAVPVQQAIPVVQEVVPLRMLLERSARR